MADLNAYQQSKLNDLNKMKAMTPEQYAQSNGTSGNWFDPGNYKSMQDWMGADLLYQAYSREYDSEGTGASKKQLDARTQQLSDMWNSGNAKNSALQSNYDEILRQSQQSYDYSLAHPTSDDSFMDKLMGNVFPAVIGGFMGAGAMGLLGSGGAAAAGGLSDMATGVDAAGLSGTAGGTLSSTVGMSSAGVPTITTVGAAGGAGAGLGSILPVGAGLGIGIAGVSGTDPTAPTDDQPTGVPNNAVDPNIPQVPVVGSTGASGLPASTIAGTAGVGLLGAGALAGLGGGPSSLPPLSDMGGVQVPDSSLPPLGLPTGTPTPDIPNSDITPPEGNGLGGLTGGGFPSLPGGLTPGNILGGLGTLAGGIADYHMNNADKDYYQGILDKLNGMYNPGTPEANLMQSQMDAKDAAAGRNSQYGTRSMNLAGILNQQRSNIMTSPGYVTLAQDARGHYDNSLNGIFSAIGQASTAGSSLNGLLNSGVGSAVNTGIKSAGSYLSNIFSPSYDPSAIRLGGG